jgi:HlyD family secretion protein
VSYVAAATATDEATDTPYYLSYIDVPAAELAKLGANKMVPGMPVEVYVMTEARTALSYLAKPLVDKFQKAFREE